MSKKSGSTTAGMGSSHSSAGYDEVASKKESADEWGAKTSISLTDTGLIIYERLELRKKWWNRENGRLTHFFSITAKRYNRLLFYFLCRQVMRQKIFFLLVQNFAVIFFSCCYSWVEQLLRKILFLLGLGVDLPKKLLMGSHQLGDSTGPG